MNLVYFVFLLFLLLLFFWIYKSIGPHGVTYSPINMNVFMNQQALETQFCPVVLRSNLLKSWYLFPLRIKMRKLEQPCTHWPSSTGISCPKIMYCRVQPRQLPIKGLFVWWKVDWKRDFFWICETKVFSISHSHTLSLSLSLSLFAKKKNELEKGWQLGKNEY